LSARPRKVFVHFPFISDQEHLGKRVAFNSLYFSFLRESEEFSLNRLGLNRLGNEKCYQRLQKVGILCGQDEDEPAASPKLPSKVSTPPPSSSSLPLLLPPPDKSPDSASISQERPAIDCFPGQTFPSNSQPYMEKTSSVAGMVFLAKKLAKNLA